VKLNRATSVLVAYADGHSTAEIAEQIADRLMKSGLAAVVRPASQIDNLQAHRAVVLGSAVHDHGWPPEAAEFLHRFAEELARLPLWLFSTGSDKGHNALVGLKRRHFTGVFERGGWPLLGDLFSRVCGGPASDRRDWREVNEWSAGIAREMQTLDRSKERRRLHLSVRGKP
jgi:menaquinone-dependent protoporphyrinogen oxidase